MFGKKDDNLLAELAALGKQIQKSLVAAAQSDELKELGSEVKAGLKNVGGKAAEAIAAAKKSREGKELGDQLKKVAKSGAASGEKAYENVAHGLSELGSELAKLAEKLKDRYKK